MVSSLSLADRKEFAETEVPVLGRIWGIWESLFAQRDDGERENARRQRNATELVMKELSVQPVPMSRIVKINFSDRSPLVAQQVSDAIAENFVAMTLDRRFSASSYARTFLEEKLQQIKLKLEEFEKQVVAYAQKEGIVNVDDKISVVGANLKALNESLATATAERIKTEQLWSQAQAGNAFGLPQVLNDKLIEKARGMRTDLMAEYQDKLGVMKPDFPEMKQLRARIAEYESQIRGQIDLVKRAIKAQYEAARDQEASFLKKMEILKAEVLDLRNRSIQYNILQRELDTNRSLYDGLLQQYKEVGVTGAVSTNNVSIIDKAKLPRKPSSPESFAQSCSGVLPRTAGPGCDDRGAGTPRRHLQGSRGGRREARPCSAGRRPPVGHKGRERQLCAQDYSRSALGGGGGVSVVAHFAPVRNSVRCAEDSSRH